MQPQARLFRFSETLVILISEIGYIDHFVQDMFRFSEHVIKIVEAATWRFAFQQTSHKRN